MVSGCLHAHALSWRYRQLPAAICNLFLLHGLRRDEHRRLFIGHLCQDVGSEFQQDCRLRHAVEGCIQSVTLMDAHGREDAPPLPYVYLEERVYMFVFVTFAVNGGSAGVCLAKSSKIATRLAY